MEDAEFVSLSPLKKNYYFLLQSMFNKRGEFYYKDAYFAAALNCEIDTISKIRREFVKKGWITIVPGRWDKHGRGISTTYKSVRWAKTPKKEEGLQFAKFQRYALEMMLDDEVSHDSIVVYVALSYWKHFNFIDDDNGNTVFFITKSKLKELTGFNGIEKLESCIKELYSKIKYDGDDHLFEYKDLYHKFKFYSWSNPSDPAESEINYKCQKAFWDKVVKRGKELQEKKQKAANKKQLAELESVYDYFKECYNNAYNSLPNPYSQQINELINIASKIGVENTKKAINYFFLDVSHKKRNNLSRFLEQKVWEKLTNVK